MELEYFGSGCNVSWIEYLREYLCSQHRSASDEVGATDGFRHLGSLDKHGRNVAANLALHLDRDRAYVNTRLPELADRGLLRKIGPAPNAGLYEITASGQRAVAHREQYDSAEFETLVRGETEG